MKRTLCMMLSLLLALLAASVAVSATDYTAFDIRFEEKEGEKVNATKLTIMAAVNDGSLTDRTADFTLEGVSWFRYLPQPEAGKTAEDYDYVDEDLKIYGILCTDDDVFDHAKYAYFLRIDRLYAKEEDSFTRQVKINGVDVDDVPGLCFNTGNEFFIKTVTNGKHGAADEPDEDGTTAGNAGTGAPEDPTAEKKKCPVCGICPVQPLGICLFIWLAILLVVILAVVLLVLKKKKDGEKKDDADKSDPNKK